MARGAGARAAAPWWRAGPAAPPLRVDRRTPGRSRPSGSPAAARAPVASPKAAASSKVRRDRFGGGTRLPLTARDPRLDLGESCLEPLLVGPEDRVRGRSRGAQDERPKDGQRRGGSEDASDPSGPASCRPRSPARSCRGPCRRPCPESGASSRSLRGASRSAAVSGPRTARLTRRNARRGPPATMKAVPPAIAAVLAGLLRTLAGMSTAVRADASSVSNSSPSAVRAARTRSRAASVSVATRASPCWYRW